MSKRKVDWSEYEGCDTCLQGPGEQCIHLQINEPIDVPHKGREKRRLAPTG